MPKKHEYKILLNWYISLETIKQVDRFVKINTIGNRNKFFVKVIQAIVNGIINPEKLKSQNTEESKLFHFNLYISANLVQKFYKLNFYSSDANKAVETILRNPNLWKKVKKAGEDEKKIKKKIKK